MRRTWVEISMPALRRNFLALRRMLPSRVAVCCVVKADGYGHGAVECARVFEQAAATWFGVTNTEEGVLLRRHGIRGQILLLSGFLPGEEEAIAEHRLTPAVWDVHQIEKLEAADRRIRSGRAGSHPPVSVHVKVDTGLSRLGVTPSGVRELAEALRHPRHVAATGIFTHFAAAEIFDSPQTEFQLSEFNRSVDVMRSAGLSALCSHAANSAALISCRGSWYDMVRPGIALYGYGVPLPKQPSGTTGSVLRPPLTWKTRVLALRQLAKGDRVSYGGTYVASSDMKIAVLAVGYADGFSRRYDNGARVIIRGQYAGVVGRVTMDLTIADVTSIDSVQTGDEVVLIGNAGSASLSAEDHASWCGTISYEILCGISKRVPRVYLER